MRRFRGPYHCVSISCRDRSHTMEWRLGVPDAKADLDGELNGELSHEQKLPRGSSSYMAWLVASALALACNQAGDYSSARGKRERVNVTSQHELLTGESDEVPALIATVESVVVFPEES